MQRRLAARLSLASRRTAITWTPLPLLGRRLPTTTRGCGVPPYVRPRWFGSHTKPPPMTPTRTATTPPTTPPTPPIPPTPIGWPLLGASIFLVGTYLAFFQSGGGGGDDVGGHGHGHGAGPAAAAPVAAADSHGPTAAPSAESPSGVPVVVETTTATTPPANGRHCHGVDDARSDDPLLSLLCLPLPLSPSPSAPHHDSSPPPPAKYFDVEKTAVVFVLGRTEKQGELGRGRAYVRMNEFHRVVVVVVGCSRLVPPTHQQ